MAGGRLFVCDVHIPPKLVAFLKAHGHDAVHVSRLGLGTSEDRDIWAYAAQHHGIVISKDTDFIALSVTRPGPKLILVCLGNCSNPELEDRLQISLEQILGYFDSGAGLVELNW